MEDVYKNFVIIVRNPILNTSKNQIIIRVMTFAHVLINAFSYSYEYKALLESK